MGNSSVSKKGNMNDKKEYPTAAKLLSWLPAIFVAAAICWFSAQPAAESTEMSDTVSRLILILGTKLGFFPRKSGAVRRPHRTYELPRPKSRSYD